ncbi:MAG: branched-chain amino acid ABC transporter permease [Anaerolineae bacterium]
MRRLRQRPNQVSVLIFLVVGALVPLVVTSPYWHSLLIVIGLYTMLGVGLALLMGYAGQVSLGQPAFYGLGAYTAAILTTRLTLNPWLALVAGIAVATLMAVLIGVPLFYLRGHALAMGTLALTLIFYVLVNETVALTLGPSGITGVPTLTIGPFAFDSDVRYYYLVLVAVAAVLFISLRLVNSHIGRALRAIRDSELAAETMGVDTAQHKRIVFIIAAAFAGLAGGLYAFYLHFVSPPPFGFGLSAILITMVVVGGLASVWGSMVGVAAVTLLTEVIRSLAAPLAGQSSAEYQIVVYGLLLMVIMIFYPDGLGRTIIDRVAALRAPAHAPPASEREG